MRNGWKVDEPYFHVGEAGGRRGLVEDGCGRGWKLERAIQGGGRRMEGRWRGGVGGAG